jgi:hypothetical protein
MTISAGNYLDNNVDDKRAIFNQALIKKRLKTVSNIKSLDYLDLISIPSFRDKLEFSMGSKRQYKSGFMTTNTLLLQNRRETYSDYNFYEHWAFRGAPSEKEAIYDYFNIKYLIENKYRPGIYTVTRGFRYSLPLQTNAIYDNDLEKIYDIELE